MAGVNVNSELSLIEQVKLGKIWEFPGGIHPPERKSLSNQNSIANFTSHTLYIPLQQHIGAAGKIIVEVGESVLKGQALTTPTEGLSLPVHAPTSGIIKQIVEHTDAHPSGRQVPTIVLEADGKDLWVNRNGIDNWREEPRERLVKHIQNRGISGLGGASFPTYVKLNPTKNIDLLILNGVECEPYITSDDVLMRYHAEEVVAGAQILKHLVDAELCIIAIEDNKPEAIAAVRSAVSDYDNIEVRVVPTKYPSGGEKQLIELITGQHVPSGRIPADIGIVMQNVGTSYAVKRAIIDDEALVARVVTVTGERVNNPQNFWVPLGTPIRALLQNVGFSPETNQRLIMGGPMMGFNIVDDMMPVVKSTNCILAPSEYHLPERGVEQACIRCGLCADACPAELLPQQLHWFAKADDHEKLNEYDLFDCIECGACSYVCPSQIPLVQYYRIAKADISQAEEEKRKAEKAKRRFEERQARLERDKQARLQKHKEAADKRKKALEKDDSAKDKIAAALARAKAKKAGASELQEAPEQANTAQDKVAAAIARAKAKKHAASQDEVVVEATASIENAEINDAPKDKVAAAIARAKAKKQAAQKTQVATPVNNEGAIEGDAPKDKVAAAIARAKAKKQAAEKAKTTNESASELDVSKDNEDVSTNSPSSDISKDNPVSNDKNDKVAAAIARAKAKKLAKENAETADEKRKDTVVTDNVTTPSVAPEVAPESPLSAADERKAKVAAAVAKAKAKKLAQSAETVNTDESVSTPESTYPVAQTSETTAKNDSDAIRKEKVAAAIAKAKAKRAQQNATDGSDDQ